SRLGGLPDMDEPFDVRAFAAFDVPKDQNAYTLYRRAHDRLKVPRLVETAARKAGYDWTRAGPAVRDWLEMNRAGLGLWREGTERREALYIRAEDFTIRTGLDVDQDQRSAFAALAMLEASRLARSGDVAGAWGWYRAALRASRHCGAHGCIV